MSATALLNDLKQVQKELVGLTMKDEEMYQNFADLIQRNRSVGCKNICKILMGEKTPGGIKRS